MATGGAGRRLSAHLVGGADADGLRERAEALAADRGRRSAGPHEATDTTGMVGVTVDDRARVLDVAVARRWRERLPPSGFAEALHEAYVGAVRASFESAALAAEAGDHSRLPDGSWPRAVRNG
ncbi:hypothetical protein ACN27F_30865 [Solwaraspora sp. WMMB335]|uniref:hypothetical protein n=1 Tax=Solwaraspora sp. WMMB335 TaxID=3404118 RepID=UPI003B961E49